MANREQLAILDEGADTWNRYRDEYFPYEIDLTNAPLAGRDLARVDLHGANLTRADLNGTILTGADLRDTNLTQANLTDAILKGAVLTKAFLRDALLIRTVLVRAILTRAILTRAILFFADLTDAILVDANLADAILTNTILTRAILTDAGLTGAILTRTNLADADLTDACVGWAVFADSDLSSARGIDTIRHTGPSSVGIDMIYKSAGNISALFMRGAGLPEDFITYLPSLIGKAMEFYSCFISYSTKDQEFADRLYADLQNNGVRCWFAPHDMSAGKKLHEQIDEAIRMHDKLLLILSPSSMKSEWVKTEISKARKREIRDSKRVLFPVRVTDFHSLQDWECFDADAGKDSAREIREYFIPDFSNWKEHDSYQEAFTRLLKDLKAETTK